MEILSGKSFNLKLSGYEVYYTTWSLLVIVKHSRSELHRQKVLNFFFPPIRSVQVLSVYLVSPISRARALSLSKVDRFVPHTWLDNLGIVGDDSVDGVGDPRPGS